MNKVTKNILRALKGIIILGIILFLIIFTAFFLRTGKVSGEDFKELDKRDLAIWNYSQNGIIIGAERIYLPGDNNNQKENITCWLLIHGYTSTPKDMKELAESINKEFKETVVVPRLEGHGEVPSKILSLSLDNWYEQVQKEFKILESSCKKVNVVGFSFGGALATRLAEKEKLNNLYLISPYIYLRYKLFRLFRLETYINIFSGFMDFSKKGEVAQINNETEKKQHIAYWNMPFAPIENSEDFISNLKTEIHNINNPTLIQQSKNDDTIDIESSYFIYDNINSSIKEIVVFNKSNHVLLIDYDKTEAINNILDFENKQRQK